MVRENAAHRGVDRGSAPAGAREHERDCTEEGCADSFTLTISAAQGMFPVGNYEVSVDASPICTFRTSSQGVAETDCPVPFAVGGQANAVPITLHPNSDTLDVVITLDGVSVVSETVQASYDDFYPNGEDCAPRCRNGTASVSVPADAGSGGSGGAGQ
jgi:hypothetical protein